MPNAVHQSPRSRDWRRDGVLARDGARHRFGLPVNLVAGISHTDARAARRTASASGAVPDFGVVAVVRDYVHRRALLPLPTHLHDPAHPRPRGYRAVRALRNRGAGRVHGRVGRPHKEPAPGLAAGVGGVRGGGDPVPAAPAGAVVRGAGAARGGCGGHVRRDTVGEIAGRGEAVAGGRGIGSGGGAGRGAHGQVFLRRPGRGVFAPVLVLPGLQPGHPRHPSIRSRRRKQESPFHRRENAMTRNRREIATTPARAPDVASTPCFARRERTLCRGRKIVWSGEEVSHF